MSAPPTTPVRAARTEPAPHGAGPTPGGRPSSPGSSRDGVGAVVLLGGGLPGDSELGWCWGVQRSLVFVFWWVGEGCGSEGQRKIWRFGMFLVSPSKNN